MRVPVVSKEGRPLMPSKVNGKLTNRRQLRRARRYRKTRRREKRLSSCFDKKFRVGVKTRQRFNNRKRKEGWIAPSQLAKVQLRIHLVRDLVKIFPIKYLAVEEVRFNHYKKQWGEILFNCRNW